MKGYGKVDGELKIEMIHPQQVEPQLEGALLRLYNHKGNSKYKYGN